MREWRLANPGVAGRGSAERNRRWRERSREKYLANQGRYRTGCHRVYVVTHPDWPDFCKIGMTTVNPNVRLGQFNGADPLKRFAYAALVEVEDAAAAEKTLHDILDADRVREDGEWFKTPVDVAVRLVESFRIRRDCNG